MSRTRLTVTAALGAAALLALAACGSAATTGTPAAGSSPSSTTGGTTGSGGYGGFSGRMPGASGTVAAIQGKTLQVQNAQQGQVAVSYTASTAFTDQVDASLAEVKIGDCVVVMPASSSSGGSSSSTVTAGSVRITQPVKGACSGGLGGVRAGSGGFSGGFGGGSGGFPSGRPSGFPSNLPSGFPSGGTFRSGGGFAGASFGAFGKVTAVSGQGFTVSSAFRAPGQSTSAQARKVAVTVDGSTSYTTTRTGTAAELKVGLCVTATGRTDDTGAVTASSIAISRPVDGSCTTGFGFRTRFAGGTGGTGVAS